MYNGNTAGISKFRVGVSPSVTASVLDTAPFSNTAKIAYYDIPIASGYITFSVPGTDGYMRANIKLPLSVLPQLFRQSVKTIYLKGTIRSNGLDGVYIKDLVYG